MSRPIFPPVAAAEAGVCRDAPPTAQHAGYRRLTPGQRLIDGRVFYSAAWLDQATSTRPEPPALKRGRDADRERSGSAAPGPTRVEG